jgi:hypothetical protein
MNIHHPTVPQCRRHGQATRWLQALALLACIAALGACGTPPGAGQHWTGYPSLFQAPHNDYNWLVVECRFSDMPNVPANLDTTIRQFLGISGVGYGNLVDYFHDVSYNGATVYADGIVDWVAAPFALGDVTNERGRLFGPGKRTARVQECLGAIPEAQTPDYRRYYGVITVSNAKADGGACYDGPADMTINDKHYRLACVVLDPDSLFTAFAAHEVSHGLGLPHSYDDSSGDCGGGPGEYCDPWDIMSALRTYTFAGNNWLVEGNAASAGPGMSAPNLLKMGWLPTDLVETLQWPDDGSEQTSTLRALSHPAFVDGQKMAIGVPAGGAGPFDGYYTVEYRQADGWDAGFASDANAPFAAKLQGGAVLVHQYRAAGTPVARLMETANSGALVTNQRLTVSAPGGLTFHVQVNAIDTRQGTASVTIGVGP